MFSNLLSPEMLKVVAGSLVTSFVAISLFFIGRIFERKRDIQNAKRNKETDMLLTMLENFYFISELVSIYISTLGFAKDRFDRKQESLNSPLSEDWTKHPKYLQERFEIAFGECHEAYLKISTADRINFTLLSHASLLHMDKFADDLSALMDLPPSPTSCMESHFNELDIEKLTDKSVDLIISCSGIIETEYQERWGDTSKKWYHRFKRKPKES